MPGSRALPAVPAPQAPQQATAEQRYKNIQMLKSVPASQLMSMMHIMRVSLGVHCDYRQMTENEQYERGDKKPKHAARRMIAMTLEMNKAYYDGRTVITCNSCHQGQIVPAAVMPIGERLFPDTTRSPKTEQRPVPTVAQEIERYMQAVGGAGGVRKNYNEDCPGRFLSHPRGQPGHAKRHVEIDELEAAPVRPIEPPHPLDEV